MKIKLSSTTTQLGVLVFCLSLFSSCLKDECTELRTFIEFQPLYANPDHFRVDAETQEARAMKNTGKLYFYNDLIFINEKYEGVHIIDNQDPANPTNIAFLSIPGNVDVAIRGGDDVC